MGETDLERQRSGLRADSGSTSTRERVPFLLHRSGESGASAGRWNEGCVLNAGRSRMREMGARTAHLWLKQGFGGAHSLPLGLAQTSEPIGQQQLLRWACSQQPRGFDQLAQSFSGVDSHALNSTVWSPYHSCTRMLYIRKTATTTACARLSLSRSLLASTLLSS